MEPQLGCKGHFVTAIIKNNRIPILTNILNHKDFSKCIYIILFKPKKFLPGLILFNKYCFGQDLNDTSIFVVKKVLPL